MKYAISFQIVFFLFTLGTLGQRQWRQLTVEDGLSSDRVHSILQSENGAVWIGTDKGIDRYNGIFESNPTNGAVDTFFELASGQIIACCLGKWNQRSLYLFNGKDWKSIDVFNDLYISDLPEFIIEANRKIWVATRNGLVSFDGIKWEQYDTDVSVEWLVKTSDGQIWTENWRTGLMSFDGQNWKSEFETENSLLDLANTNTVIVDSNSKILMGTDLGLFQYDPFLNSVTDLKLGKISVTEILQATDHTLWVGTAQGLYKLNGKKWQLSLPGQSITTIQQADNGQIWVGTTSGLYRLDTGKLVQELAIEINCIAELSDGTLMVGGPRGLKLLQIQEDLSRWGLQPLVGKMIVGFLKTSNGVLWCRTDAGILSFDEGRWTNQTLSRGLSVAASWDSMGNIYEAEDGGIWFNVAPVYSYKNGIFTSHNTSVWARFVSGTDDGNIWIGGSGVGGLYQYDGTSWTLLKGYGGSPNSVVVPLTLYQTTDGVIWVHGEQGLWSYDGTRWDEHLKVSGEVVLEDNAGILWVGSSDGIYQLAADGKWTKSIQSGYIRMIEQTSRGGLAAVDQNGGLLTYDGQRWSKHPSYGTDRLYRNNWGKGFVEHPDGVFWLATDKGLRRIEDDFWYDLTVYNGLPSNSVHTVEKDDQGNLWVGTDNGLMQYTPPLKQNPPVIQFLQ